MSRDAFFPATPAAPAARRPVRAFVLALSVALASGVALAAWSATTGLAPSHGPLLPRGASLDRLLDQAQASPTQRAQAHQIFDAADRQLRQNRAAELADRQQMAQLFAQPLVDPAAVESVRGRIGQRHELESRRATQALIDVSMVLSARQRQAIAGELAGERPLFDGLRHPLAAPVAMN